MPLLPPKTLSNFPIGAIKNPAIVKQIAATGLEELYIDVNVLGNLIICFDAKSDATVVEHLLPARIERVDSASFTGGVMILNGGEGDVEIQGQFGEVAGITHSKNINIHLRGGDVSLNELSGNASIHLAVGSATLGWTELRGTEQINIHARVGFGGLDLLNWSLEESDEKE